MSVVAAGTNQISNLHRHHLHGRLVPDKNQGDQVIIPHPEELEDADGGQCRNRQRQNELAEDCKRAGTLHKRRLEQILGQLADKVVHKVCYQQQAKRGRLGILGKAFY